MQALNATAVRQELNITIAGELLRYFIDVNFENNQVTTVFSEVGSKNSVTIENDGKSDNVGESWQILRPAPF